MTQRAGRSIATLAAVVVLACGCGGAIAPARDAPEAGTRKPTAGVPVTAAPEPTAGVTAAKDLVRQGAPWFEDGEVAGYSMEAQFLIYPGEDQATLDGVLAAVPRLFAIDEHGFEIDPAIPLSYDRWTPGYVAAFHTSAGVALIIDTDGDLPLVQGEALVAVLVEELTAHGAKAHIGVLPEEVELGEEISS